MLLAHYVLHLVEWAPRLKLFLLFLCEELGGVYSLCLELVFPFLNHPIEDVVVFKPHSVKEVFEKLSKVGVVRPVLKLQLSAVVHVLGKLFREPIAQLID